MSDFARCPECARRFHLPSSDEPEIRCPFCDALVEGDDGEREDNRPSSRRARSKRRSNAKTLLVIGLVGCGTLVVLCAGGIGIFIWWLTKSTSFPEQTEDYAQARQHFQTKLIRQGAAPQEWQIERPPAGVREQPYLSGALLLRAWVSGPPLDRRRRPAVLFLHGGFAFGADDWEQTQPFRDAGFVVMTPTLRGENGLPGSYSMFYNEVEDVLAAAETLARLSYVDSNRIYVAGHSVGGTLTMLAAMTSNRFRAAASFSGSPDQASWARLQPGVVPFDPADEREFQMRSPLAFPRSFKCPVRLYFGSQEFLFASNSQKTAQLAKAAGLDVEAMSVPGEHMTMVEPAMRQAIAFFQQK
ncbi:MAG: alpha/beta hydrolase family protein [Gemmataceae bacterium]